MEIIIAVIIAVVGWGITHFLTIRAQKKNFINQVVNNARLEITSTIRDYQDWLVNINAKISASSFDVIRQQHGLSVDWLQKSVELNELFFSDRSARKWIFRLEEYEILFPKTAKCRDDLVDRHRQINEYLSLFLQELRCTSLMEPAALEQRKKAIEKAQNNLEIVIDQIALMEDLRIYLQNLCLGSFTGNKVPERKPGDSSVPRLVPDKKGNLEIIVPQKTPKNGSE